MGFVEPLSFETARGAVLRRASECALPVAVETVPLFEAAGRILASDAHADRNYPPLPRSIRDGYAVRSSGFPGKARVIGEVRAGQRFPHAMQPGEAVEIMTGAPVPAGADSVVMVEHAIRDGDWVTPARPVCAGDFIVPAGAECTAGSIVLAKGSRLDFGNIAALATIGLASVTVYRPLRVSILATGDEIVPVDAAPAPQQIRNSNTYTLAAQVRRAGAVPVPLSVAPDEYQATRDLIREGLSSDLLLLSGGVSAGKYDLVEDVLAGLGAKFHFDRVRIQPGQPLVFGSVGGKLFFGLPGNPVSTMVTFELFARAAIELLGGCTGARLPLSLARLRSPFRHKPGLTRFLPACIHEGEVDAVPWQGSGDVFALARANAFLVARDDRESWEQGDTIEVLPR